MHSDQLPKQPATLQSQLQRTEQPAPLSSRCCSALFRSKLSVGSRVRNNLAAIPYPARLRVSTGVLILIVTFVTRACDVLESLEPESSGRVAKATMRMGTPVETRSWARVGVGRKIGSDARPSREFQTEKGRQWQDESVAQLSGCKHQGCRVADRFGDRSDCK